MDGNGFFQPYPGSSSHWIQPPGTPFVSYFFRQRETPKTSNYCLKNRVLFFPGIYKWMAIRFQVPGISSLVGILRRVAFTMLADFSSEKKIGWDSSHIIWPYTAKWMKWTKKSKKHKFQNPTWASSFFFPPKFLELTSTIFIPVWISSFHPFSVAFPPSRPAFDL